MSGPSRTRRTCIFCGDRSSTKEDAWPKWIGRLITKMSRGEKVSMELRGAGLTQARHQTWKADTLEQKVRAVCARCNGGWMSDLEASVQPFLAPMIESARATMLDLRSQRLTALWATKMAMVFEHVGIRGPIYYTHDQRYTLRDTLMPLDGTSVWIGRYAGGRMVVQNLSHVLGRPRKGSATMCGHSATLWIGKLVVQVLGYQSGELGIGQDDVVDIPVHPGPWNTTLLQVWPTSRASGVSWPPNSPLRDDTVLLLSNRFVVRGGPFF